MMRASLLAGMAALAVALLSGCADDAPYPETAATAAQTIPPQLEVQRQDSSQRVFLAADGGLSATGRDALDRLVATAGKGDPQKVHIEIRGEVLPRAGAALTRALLADGIDPAKIILASARGDAPANIVDVTASTYRVIRSHCPRLSRIRVIGPDNPTASSNYGCSNALALEAMVADPRDLVMGEAGGQSDSDTTSAAITRLRTDKLKSYLDQGSTLSVGAGP